MSRSQRRFDVYLTGFMGAGKSTAGRLLAARLGWEFVDLDDVIEQREGKSIANIFAEHGEKTFRQIEANALAELLSNRKTSDTYRVVALGGGTLTSADNRRRLAGKHVKVVFLDAPTETLRRRCEQNSADRVRPLAGDALQFARLHAQRQKNYRQAGLRIDTENRSIEQIVFEIAQQLELELHTKENPGA